MVEWSAGPDGWSQSFLPYWVLAAGVAPLPSAHLFPRGSTDSTRLLSRTPSLLWVLGTCSPRVQLHASSFLACSQVHLSSFPDPSQLHPSSFPAQSHPIFGGRCSPADVPQGLWSVVCSQQQLQQLFGWIQSAVHDFDVVSVFNLFRDRSSFVQRVFRQKRETVVHSSLFTLEPTEAKNMGPSSQRARLGGT